MNYEQCALHDAQRKIDARKSGVKYTFEVYKLASVSQRHESIEDEIMVHPNLSDKNTTVKPPKLLDRVRDKLRVKHYGIRTKQTYLDWIKRYIFFHDKQHPKTRKVSSRIWRWQARFQQHFTASISVSGLAFCPPLPPCKKLAPVASQSHG